jgi:drug/metabolite transporter (DMT)-like permease
MQIRPGRERSLVGGVVALLVMVVGVVMMLSFGGFSNFLLPFLLIWVLIGLVGAAVSFYNAFSRRGLPLYEVDMDEEEGTAYCPHCGRPVGREDEFCRHCGQRLSE